MAQRRQLTWTEWRVGLFVLVALFVIAVGIFYVTGAGFLGPKYRLRTYLPEVAGVTNGAPVRLDGVDIGNVESIRVVPRTAEHAPEKTRSIELVMRLDKRFQPDILTDSTASLVTEGTLGKLLTDPSLYDEAKQAISNGNAVISDVRSGKGSLGKLASDDELYNKLRDSSNNLANATAKLNDNTTTAGKLFSDPKLYDNLTGLTGDLRLLIGDFRQNPKKFLRIKVAVF